MNTVFTTASGEETVPQKSPFTPFFERYLYILKTSESSLPHGHSTISVSEVLGSIAYLYEKIRNAIEYRADQVIRRNAIERILKRLLWERSNADANRIARHLIRELIWARYLKNDAIAKEANTTISDILNKYLYLLAHLKSRGTAIPFASVREWVWGIASVEIEEVLDPLYREPYVELMYQWFLTHFTWIDDDISPEEKSVQTYISIHRALTKSDEQIIRYHLFLKNFPDWQNASQGTMEYVIEQFSSVYSGIEKRITYSKKNILYRRLQRHVAPFEVLRELMKRHERKLDDVLSDISAFEAAVTEICQMKYIQIREKVNRGIVRSVIYIFVTKIVFALLIEVPYDLHFYHHIKYIPLLINIILPPVLMFILGLTIRTPGHENTIRIINRLKTIIYHNESPNVVQFSLRPVSRNGMLNTIFTVIYSILFFLVFGSIAYVLLALNFTIVGIGIFFAFLSLVLLFGYRVRYTASEFNITSEKENILSHIMSNISLPFLNIGVYLSKGLAKITIFTIIFDFLIEAPLKTIIEVFEEWSSYIREKKEEVVEVPE